MPRGRITLRGLSRLADCLRSVSIDQRTDIPIPWYQLNRPSSICQSWWKTKIHSCRLCTMSGRKRHWVSTLSVAMEWRWLSNRNIIQLRCICSQAVLFWSCRLQEMQKSAWRLPYPASVLILFTAGAVQHLLHHRLSLYQSTIKLPNETRPIPCRKQMSISPPPTPPPRNIPKYHANHGATFLFNKERKIKYNKIHAIPKRKSKLFFYIQGTFTVPIHGNSSSVFTIFFPKNKTSTNSYRVLRLDFRIRCQFLSSFGTISILRLKLEPIKVVYTILYFFFYLSKWTIKKRKEAWVSEFRNGSDFNREIAFHSLFAPFLKLFQIFQNFSNFFSNISRTKLFGYSMPSFRVFRCPGPFQPTVCPLVHWENCKTDDYFLYSQHTSAFNIKNKNEFCSPISVFLYSWRLCCRWDRGYFLFY